MSKSPSALTSSESLRLFRAYLCGHHWELGEGIAAGIHEKDTESLHALHSLPALDTSEQTPFCSEDSVEGWAVFHRPQPEASYSEGSFCLSHSRSLCFLSSQARSVLKEGSCIGGSF